MRSRVNFLRPLAASLLVLACTTASAMPGPSTTTLKVDGKITPAACALSLGGGGNLDFGTINTAAMGDDPNAPLVMFNTTRSLSLDCTVPRLVALRFTSTDPDGYLGSMTLKTPANPGAVRQSRETMARYRIFNSNATADGVAASDCGIGLLCREAIAGGADTAAPPYNMIQDADGSAAVQYFWRYGSGTAPVIRTAHVDLNFVGSVYINPLDRGEAYEAEGGFAVELTYL